jgi:hypothetical protein
MFEVWKGNNERAKKKLGGGLKQLVLSLHQINTNLKEAFRLTVDATLANNEISRIKSEINLKLKRAKIIETCTRGMSNAQQLRLKDTTNACSSNNKWSNLVLNFEPMKKEKKNYHQTNNSSYITVDILATLLLKVKPSDDG